jgi:hypothetical protein
MGCTILDLLNAVDDKGRAKLFTDSKGFKKLHQGDSFYVWTEKFKSQGDIALLVCEKDFAEDHKGRPYCVDGLDVIIL